jgi:serine/threonine protein phosphatase PrpC
VLRFDHVVVGREDRAAWFVTATGGVVVVADGAGGTGRGAAAAEAVIAAVAGRLEASDGEAWCDVLSGVDRTMRGEQTTAVVASIVGETIFGASVGDSGAWLIDAEGERELTLGQRRKPLIGSGATPVAFAGRLGSGTLLLASDGLLNYASMQRIGEVVGGGEFGGMAGRLCELVRLRSGALPDDVAVVLARADH